MGGVRQLRVTPPAFQAPGNPRQPAVLRRDASGHWEHHGFEQTTDLEDCIDIDLAVTPFTNTLPIRRLNLDPGESREIVVAYIAAPALRVNRSRQRYTRLKPLEDLNRYRYEGLDSGFQTLITVDHDGLVIDYPGLFKRV